ncbi:pantoate--beta-alanine ligase [Candidatus Omnitrophota bacterium]
MRTIRDINKMMTVSARLKNQGKRIGFVPTMGCLHDGHLSLMRASRKENDVSIISIFVNPLQFGPQEDYKKYPRNFKRDAQLARSVGVDVLFFPSARQIYSPGHVTSVTVSRLANGMCGASRPEHFQGVATVVAKLFNIVRPDRAYFGQKDAQQTVVIKKMVEDLNIPTKVKTLPIVREQDGLAMSSRNSYLSPKERIDALVLIDSLRLSRRMAIDGERSSRKIISTIKSLIKTKKTAKLDYVACVDPTSLQPLKRIKAKALIALAVWIGKTRLIDNIIIRV